MTHLDTIIVLVKCLNTNETYTLYGLDEGMTLLDIRYRIKSFIKEKWPHSYRRFTFQPEIQLFNNINYEKEFDCIY